MKKEIDRIFEDLKAIGLELSIRRMKKYAKLIYKIELNSSLIDRYSIYKIAGRPILKKLQELLEVKK